MGATSIVELDSNGSIAQALQKDGNDELTENADAGKTAAANRTKH
ncbi:hypothetical protein J27TS7_25630 [Paenibacillus dendritiformis]|nr:hypothetical protein J27TS7_25630 [Paenibacillus dendritiformis]